MKRRPILTSLLCLVSVVTGVAILEAGARLYFATRAEARPEAPRADRALRIFIPGRDGLPFGVKRNFQQRFRAFGFDTEIRTNNVGWRENFDYNGEPIDVGCLGDSFVFGYGVNAGERFCDRLRAKWPRRNVVGYAYANGGFPPDYYLYLTSHPEFIPRWAVLGLFLGNDLGADEAERDMQYRDGTVTAAPSHAKWVTDEGYLAHSDPIARKTNFLEISDYVAFGRLLQIAYGRFVSGTYRRLVPPEERSPIASPLHRGILDAAAQRSLNHVVKLERWLRARGTRMHVLLIPENFSVGDYRCPYRRETCEMLRRDRPLNLNVGTFLRENNIAVTDPADELAQTETSGQRTYLAGDAHWNPLGHRIAAERLAADLEGTVPIALHR